MFDIFKVAYKTLTSTITPHGYMLTRRHIVRLQILLIGTKIILGWVTGRCWDSSGVGGSTLFLVLCPIPRGEPLDVHNGNCRKTLIF